MCRQARALASLWNLGNATFPLPHVTCILFPHGNQISNFLMAPRIIQNKIQTNSFPMASKALHYLPSAFTVLRPQTPRPFPASALFLSCSSFCFHQPSTSTHVVGSSSPAGFHFPGYFLRWPLPYLSKVKSPV